MPELIDPEHSKGRRAPVGVLSVFDRPYRESVKLFGNVDRKLYDNDAWEKYRLFCIGFVRYEDFFENSYITGFCTQFDPLGQHWVLTGGKAGYNYHRKEPKKN